MAAQIEPFREWLRMAGYTPGSTRGLLMVMGQLGRWMQANVADGAPLTIADLEEFADWLRSRSACRVPRLSGNDPLRSYLIDAGVVRPPARLGLRSVEVVNLELDDIDWRAGEIVVRGKARREDRMPLPFEVGEAITAYLVSGRPASVSRRVFLTAKAPIEPMPPARVNDICRRACVRVGIGRVGAHRLRHTLASELLRHGSTIVEVSQVLRHRDLATTAIYAKVDLDTLRQVALPWPGAQP
jgi:integrase